MAKPEDFLGMSDQLLQGAYDVHMHAYPEFSNEVVVRMGNEEVARAARDAGMGGIILKSHFWPTTFMADVINKKFAAEENNPNPAFRAIGSITLNASSGGIEPWAAEAAIKMDARMVWMPTWSAANDIEGKKVSEYISAFVPSFDKYRKTGGVAILDANGGLIPNVREVLEVCKAADVAVATGHITWKESLALANAAKDMGFKKLVFTHPDSTTIGASLDVIKQMSDLGAYIELCALGLTSIYHRITTKEMGDIVRTVGAKKCVLSSDYFHEWAAPLPEQIRMIINSLLFAGVSFDDMRLIAKENAAWLLRM